MEDIDEGGYEVRKTSKINSGMLQVYRLDILWKECNKLATTGQYLKWNNVLDRVWCELAGDVTKDDKDEKEYIRLSKEFSKKTKPTNSSSGFKKHSDGDKINFVEQKQALLNKETFLRRLMNKQGKGTAYDEDDDDFE